MRYISLALKLCTLALAVAGGGFWTGAGVGSRPKYRDEQTWIGGTIWSQTIINIGLIITNMVEDNLDLFVHAYFLGTGIVMFLITGVMLVYHEYKALKRARSQPDASAGQVQTRRVRKFDKTYFGIGVICLLGALFVLVDLIIVIFLYKR
ncbi:uncharacterized protein [Choristoneura fumiferana]|uniref:uncharacterized protein n=1 Tax=Choristoneura fumiferana TaxID=7141 RepID=UPI003D15BA81